MPGRVAAWWSRRRWVAWGVFLTGCGALAAVVLQQARSLAVSHEGAQLFDARVTGGSLTIVGGGIVPLEIRRRFVELAGGSRARIVVIPASDPRPGDEERWLAPFRAIGPESVELLHADNRETADSPEFHARLRHATGVWFGGGNQALLAERYVDSPVESELQDLLARNGAIGGSSAGAAILTRVMIAEGDLEPTEGRGLGLLAGAVVDQHFLKRNRLWRLQQMLDFHPELVGVGIDEQTAIVYHLRTEQINVVGASYVVICIPDGESGRMRLEILKPGDDPNLSQLRREHLPYRPLADWDELLAGP